MKIFVFGSSLVSSYWNGAATYYRGIYKNLAALGCEIIFAEPDIYKRQQNRDPGDYSYAKSLVYRTPDDIDWLLRLASDSDLVIKHSGIGAEDALLERRVLDCRSPRTRVAFWDVDAPATLSSVEAEPLNPFRACIPEYDFVFTYGGGPPIVQRYLQLGAKNCHPVYNALEPESHHPADPSSDFACDLVFVGNRLPDRERRVEQFFLRTAELAPECKFILGGEGWGNKELPPNVRWIGHVRTGDHNRVNCSARMVLNINRESMADVGFSPPTRVFEAAGAGACLITDHWKGIETFFEPGNEILVASSADEIVHLLRTTPPKKARAIGQAMRTHALRDHLYAQRAELAMSIFRSSAPQRERHELRQAV
ncbi:conserved hypothetical protein [Candidatus Koribacter versatilis Ellin345]|uniref:Spore protein YkvP/CgeB glycosyl transferase-like domain-containing protein n=1 Tax=Koribacter versatilis (strain Ellin345) TaxID=204669 RepID=Q1ILI7_KORVE|nr:glycosyltransferase [Candidatus Koribacter versatilis]ABF42263.1 conserved hypothetical protein [Candidatus Koribacter versatilis Ellin345]